MRTREQITDKVNLGIMESRTPEGKSTHVLYASLEVLLDIRDLLLESNTTAKDSGNS